MDVNDVTDSVVGGAGGVIPQATTTSPVQAPIAKGQRIKHLRSRGVDVCFEMGDVESLIKLHEQINLDDVDDHDEESTGAGGDYIKALVFGGLDGIVSTFALVASLGGANVPIGTLIAVSLAKVVADAFSMGFGEFTSATAEVEHAQRIQAREEWEMDHHFDGEVKEMCKLYEDKGCSKEDSLTILTILSKYHDLFLETMLAMEHGILPADADDRWAPLKQGLVCFLSFMIFGLVPLCGFMILYAVEGNSGELMGRVLFIAYAMTSVTLFIMGVTKAKLTGGTKCKVLLKSGLIMVVNGTLAGGVAYIVGEVLGAALGA